MKPKVAIGGQADADETSQQRLGRRLIDQGPCAFLSLRSEDGLLSDPDGLTSSRLKHLTSNVFSHVSESTLAILHFTASEGYVSDKKDTKYELSERPDPITFMRSRHPDLYSDSETVSIPQLTEDILEYRLETLTNRNQEAEFAYIPIPLSPADDQDRGLSRRYGTVLSTI